VLLVYDQTAEGLGDAWEASDELLLGHALAPEFGRTKLYETRRALAEAGILSADKYKSEDGLSRRYRIDWEGVYAVRGLPLPERLAAIGHQAADTVAQKIRDPENPQCGQSGIRKIRNADDFSRIIRDADFSTRSISARARLSSSCLLVVDVDDKGQQEAIRAKANEVRSRIFAHRPGAKLDSETRRFLVSVAVLAIGLDERWAGWIDYALAATAQARASKPAAYLRNTLRQSLIEFAGLCDTQDEAAATMGKLLMAARPMAKTVLAACDKATPTEAVP
jgi:hypothetical protein